MALPTKVNIGTNPGDGSGDPAHIAFGKSNAREDYLEANKADKSQITALQSDVDSKETPAGAQAKADAAEASANSYTDSIAQGFKWKTPVDVATTANITLSGEQTIDGVLTAASRVLVKDQTNAAENGIYLTASGAWTRTADADSATELIKATTRVVQGTQAGEIWTCNRDNNIRYYRYNFCNYRRCYIS
jgi:phage-related tail fiber protein